MHGLNITNQSAVALRTLAKTNLLKGMLLGHIYITKDLLLMLR